MPSTSPAPPSTAPARPPYAPRYYRFRLQGTECVLVRLPRPGLYEDGTLITDSGELGWRAYLSGPDDHPWLHLPKQHQLLPPYSYYVSAPNGFSHHDTVTRELLTHDLVAMGWADLAAVQHWRFFGAPTRRAVTWMARTAAEAMWWAHPTRMRRLDLLPYLQAPDASTRDYATVHLVGQVSKTTRKTAPRPPRLPSVARAWALASVDTGKPGGELLRDVTGGYFWRSENTLPARLAAAPWIWLVVEPVPWPQQVIRRKRSHEYFRGRCPWEADMDAGFKRFPFLWDRLHALRPADPMKRN